MARMITLMLLLFAFWLLLSGHYTPFLICSGAVGALVIVWVTKRKQNLDEESVPHEAFLGALIYFPWLFYEIWKASLVVAKVVLHPKLPISPVMTVVECRTKTAVGLATYANSITLTPGTVTAGQRGKRLVVYALVAAGADDIESGAMEDRVLKFEGSA